MTTVNPYAGSSTTTTDTASATRASTLDYDAFLKLLLAQMQNQDPLQPMDSTQYVSQLATFSNVEQGLKMNEKLDKLLFLSNIQQSGELIGRTVTSADGKVSGVVEAVRVETNGATAIFADGTELFIDEGVTVSA